MERRFSNPVQSGLQLRSNAEGEMPTIIGHAAVFHRAGDAGTEYQIWDRTVERIGRAAFDDAILANDTAGLRNHDSNHLLGRQPNTLRLSVTNEGLRYEIDPPSIGSGPETVESIQRGDMRGSSFGFSVEEERWFTEGDIQVREIVKVGRLFDVGPVTFPAYEGTNTAVRSLEDAAEARASFDAWERYLADHADGIEPEERALQPPWHYRRMADLASAGLATRQEPGEFRVTPFADLPVVGNDVEWNPNRDSDASIVDEILGADGNDWAAMRRSHLSFAPGSSQGDPLDLRGAYKLRIARMHEGRLTVFLGQLSSRMAIINGAHGGVNVPESVKRAAFEHGLQYFDKLGIPKEERPERSLSE
jgi:HK97 family phage prohead protease